MERPAIFDPTTRRRVFVLAFAATGMAIVASSGWLLWPVYQEYRAGNRLLQAVRFGDQEAVDTAVAGLKGFRWKGVHALPDLAKLLSSNTQGVRWRAAYAFGELGEPITQVHAASMRGTAVPALTTALSDKNVRIRAAYALGQIGPEAHAAVSALMDALDSADQYFNGQAGDALARIGEPAVDSLLEAIASGSGQRSVRSIDVLGQMSGVEFSRRRSALVAAFEAGDLAVKSHAATALAKCGRQAVPDLVRLLENDSSLIAKALGDMGPDARDAIPALLEKSAKSGAHGYTAVNNAIGQIGGVPELVKALDLKPARYGIIQALSSRGQAAQAAIPKLVQILKTDDRSEVRNAVTWVFRNLGPDATEAVPALIELLDEQPIGQHDIRYYAVEALARIGPTAAGAIPALVNLWDSDATDRVRFAAAIALGAIDPGHPMLGSAMTEILKQSTHSSYERHEAMRLIVKLRPAATPAVPLLIEELNGDRTSPSLLAAIEALGAIGAGAADAVPMLIELLNPAEPPSTLQAYTIRTLGAIGPDAKPVMPRLMELLQRPELAQGPNKNYRRIIMNAILSIDPTARIDDE